MSDPIVVIDRLRKVYEPHSRAMKLLLRTAVTEPVMALEDVSLEVMPGEIRAVLGPNGAGKSTLFRILTGLTTPTSGTATIRGRDATTESASVRKMIGFMPAENRTLLLRHSCRENLAFHGQLQGIPRAELADRVDMTLETVGLSDARDRIGFALSSGMLARLLLARAILHEPGVLILDEPTAAVDPIGSFELLEMIQRIARERNLAVLISSHRLDEVELLNEKVLLLNRGKVVYSGELASMTVTARRPRIEVVFEKPENAEAGYELLRLAEGVEDATLDEDSLLLTTERSVANIVAELNGHGYGIVSIGRTPPRLRDVLGAMLGNTPEGAES